MSLPQLAHFRARLAAFGFSPPALVLVALLVGLIALPLIARGHFAAAIAAIVISRAIAVLGRSGAPGLSAKLDPVFLASLPFGFALADPERAPVAAFLLFGFVVATAAARVGIVETLFASAAFVVACIRPEWFSLIAYGLGMACFVLAGLRLARDQA